MAMLRFHVAEFKAAHVAREMAMVRAEVNHPSIVIWSLGNEAGPGDNFKACYKAIKDFDASRPIQYERNNEIVDMGSNQYPSIAWVRNAVKGDAKLKYPEMPLEISWIIGMPLNLPISFAAEPFGNGLITDFTTTLRKVNAT